MRMTTSSATTSTQPEQVSLSELLQHRHANYVALPEELSPASRPASPTSEDRIASLRTQLVALVHLAGGDATDPKWGYVSRKTALACTSRRYVGTADGVRVGDGCVVSVGKKFKWELPETEEAWAEYEARWTAAVAEEEARRKMHAARSKLASVAGRTSKYFQAPLTVVQEPAGEPEPPGEPEPEPRPSAPGSEAKTVQEKVERWQAQVIAVPNVENLPNTQKSVTLSQSPKIDKSKAKELLAQGEKIQTSLGFRVAKRSSVQSAKGDGPGSSKPKTTPPIRAPTPPRDSSRLNSCGHDAPQQATPIARISDLPEYVCPCFVLDRFRS